MIQTLVPLGVILLLYLRWKEKKDVDFIGWSSLILYVLLPSANLTLVRVIKCMDFPDGTSWVAADLSLQCSHEDGTLVTGHLLMVIFAWIMMLFWGPIGVPLSLIHI